jgi:hypothetical protein
MRNILTIKINTFILNGKTETVTAHYDSLQDNFVEICLKAVNGVLKGKEKLSIDDFHNHTISFDDYYDQTPLMLNHQCFPYLFNNEIYAWYVPYKDVTIEEFLNSNNLNIDDVITVYLDNYAGEGSGYELNVILHWVYLLMDITVTSVEFFKIASHLIRVVISHFRSKQDNKKLVDLSIVRESIRIKEKWTTEELYKALGTDDKEFISKLLAWCGYSEEKGEYCRLKERKNYDPIHKFEKKIWGMDFGRFQGLCNDLNKSLLILRIITEKKDKVFYDYAIVDCQVKLTHFYVEF